MEAKDEGEAWMRGMEARHGGEAWRESYRPTDVGLDARMQKPNTEGWEETGSWDVA